MKEKLTSKQKKFALEFLISGNITDAAKKAGYSERPARQIGSLNLTKPNVVEYMNEILEKSYRRIHWCRGIIWSNFYDRYGFR